MQYEYLFHKKQNHIMIVDFPDIPIRQVDKLQLANELRDLFSGLSWDSEVRAVLVKWKQKQRPLLEENWTDGFYWLEEDNMRQGSLSLPVEQLEIPVITCIEGYAIGQGLELALAGDIRVATKGSWFGLPQIQMGLIPWDGGTQRFPRLVGKSKALEMILTGEIINAEEALRIGLIHKVVESGRLDKEAMDMAKTMCTRGPVALRYAKEAIKKGTEMPIEQALRLEADLYLLIHTTRDRTEGITAFRQKRKAIFEGR